MDDGESHGEGSAVGVVWTVLTAVMLGLAGYGVARHGLRQPAGWPRALGAATLAWSWALLGLQVLGATGHLDRLSLLTWATIGLLAAAGFRARAPRGEAPLPGGSAVLDVPAILALGLTLGAITLLGLPSLLIPPKIVSDGPIYHLFFAAKWWKAGRVFLVASPFGENAATYFPANGDLWFAGLMTLWGGDRTSRVGQAPFLLLAALTTFALARRAGASASAAVVAVAWFVTSVPFLLFSFEANVDTIFVAGYLLAVYFGLRHAFDGGGAPALILAGLAAGASWGTKPTGTAFVPPLLAVIGLGVVWKETSWRARAGRLTILAASSLALSGYWFGRNAWLTGNPLYPLHVSLFGRAWLPGWYESRAMRMSQFYLPIDDVEALYGTVASVFDPRLLPLWTAALVGAWAWWRKPAAPAGLAWICAGLAAFNVASYWILIPYRTQQRFMLQALGLAAVPLAILLDRGRLLRWLAVALVGVRLATDQAWPLGFPGDPSLPHKIPIPTAALRLPLSWAALRMAWSDPGTRLFQGFQATVLVGALVVAAFWARAARRPSARRWAVAGVLTASGLGGFLVALNDSVEGRGGLVGHVYPIFDKYARGWRVVEGLSPPGGIRVAYAGTNLPYFLMAGGLRNDVWYVNIDAHPSWTLHDYHLSARDRGDPPLWDTPRPGWDRIHPDYPAWLDNLHARRIQLLVVTDADRNDGLFNLYDADRFPIERSWAETHPGDFERIYPRDAPDPYFWVYRVRPRARGPAKIEGNRSP